MDIQQANELAQRSMSTKRFSHTLRVVQWAQELAEKHHVDEVKAQIAAYLHDIKKKSACRSK